MYASFTSVMAKKRQNTNPYPDGNFFVDLNGLGILRDVYEFAANFQLGVSPQQELQIKKNNFPSGN